MKKYQKELIGAVIIVVVAFYGGMLYGRSGNAAQSTNNGRSFSAAGFGARGTRTNGMGGAAFGDIIAKDASSITLQMRDGSGSKIVFYTTATPVMKTVVGTPDDLTVGENVSAMGTPNSDGSISAQSIQVRPIAAPSATK